MKYVTNADLSFVKKRGKGSHKGENGEVLIATGSFAYPGAAALSAWAAKAALRAGVDLVFVAAPEQVAFVVNHFLPDVITIKLKGEEISVKHIAQILGQAKECDVVVSGPGLGLSAGSKKAVLELTKKIKKPLVLDADAIKAVAGKKFRGNVLLTPHEKEFEIFSGKKISGKSLKEKIKLVKEAAKKHNCTILLKNPVDIISDGRKVLLNKTGNAGMTVGGSGDVLAGLCGAFISLGADLVKAAGCAAFVNGNAGDLLLKERGYGYIASDLVEKIPKIVYGK